MPFTSKEKLLLAISFGLIFFSLVQEPFSLEAQPLPKMENSKEIQKEKMVHLPQDFNFSMKPELLGLPNGKESNIPILISLKTPEIDINHFRRNPIDLVLVLDKSGSMAGSKIQLLKNSLYQFLEFLTPDDRIAIVQFDQQSKILMPLINMGLDGKSLAKQTVRNIIAEGGTSIFEGVKSALQILDDRQSQNPITSIFLLSDGIDDLAEKNIKYALEKYDIKDSYTIHTFGYGADHDPDLLELIANKKDGNFYFIQNYATSSEFFVNALGGLVSVFAKEVIIEVFPSPEGEMVWQGLKLLPMEGDDSWIQIGKKLVKTMNQILGGSQKDFVLNLRVPAKTVAQKFKANLVQAKVKIIFNDGSISSRLTTLFIDAGSSQEFSSHDIEVMKQRYRYITANTLVQVRKLVDNNDIQRAKRLISSKILELRSELGDDKFVEGLIEDLRNAMTYLSPEVYNNGGKHNLIGNSRAQFHQRPYFQSNNMYSNAIQDEMLKEIRNKTKYQV